MSICLGGGLVHGRHRDFSLCYCIVTNSGAQPASHPVLPEGYSHGSWSMKLTTYFHLVPKSRMHGYLPSHSLYIFMIWCLGTETFDGFCTGIGDLNPCTVGCWPDFNCVGEASLMLAETQSAGPHASCAAQPVKIKSKL
jgi:hypothetical protein